MPLRSSSVLGSWAGLSFFVWLGFFVLTARAATNITLEDERIKYEPPVELGRWETLPMPAQPAESYRRTMGEGAKASFAFRGPALYYVSPLFLYNASVRLLLDDSQFIYFSLSHPDFERSQDPNLQALPNSTRTFTVSANLSAELHTVVIDKDVPGSSNPYLVVGQFIYTLSSSPSNTSEPPTTVSNATTSSSSGPNIKLIVPVALVGAFLLAMFICLIWFLKFPQYCCSPFKRRKLSSGSSFEEPKPTPTIPAPRNTPKSHFDLTSSKAQDLNDVLSQPSVHVQQMRNFEAFSASQPQLPSSKYPWESTPSVGARSLSVKPSSPQPPLVPIRRSDRDRGAVHSQYPPSTSNSNTESALLAKELAFIPYLDTLWQDENKQTGGSSDRDNRNPFSTPIGPSRSTSLQVSASHTDSPSAFGPTAQPFQLTKEPDTYVPPSHSKKPSLERALPPTPNKRSLERQRDATPQAPTYSRRRTASSSRGGHSDTSHNSNSEPWKQHFANRSQQSVKLQAPQPVNPVSPSQLGSPFSAISALSGPISRPGSRSTAQGGSDHGHQRTGSGLTRLGGPRPLPVPPAAVAKQSPPPSTFDSKPLSAPVVSNQFSDIPLDPSSLPTLPTSPPSAFTTTLGLGSATTRYLPPAPTPPPPTEQLYDDGTFYIDKKGKTADLTPGSPIQTSPDPYWHPDEFRSNTNPVSPSAAANTFSSASRTHRYQYSEPSGSRPSSSKPYQQTFPHRRVVSPQPHQSQQEEQRELYRPGTSRSLSQERNQHTARSKDHLSDVGHLEGERLV